MMGVEFLFDRLPHINKQVFEVQVGRQILFDCCRYQGSMRLLGIQNLKSAYLIQRYFFNV